MTLEIVVVPCRADNYAYLLRDEAGSKVGLVDAPDAAAIEHALAARGWALDLILITHHHEDHIAGVERLRETYGARVAGAAADAGRLPRLDVAVKAGDTVALGGGMAEVIDVPGHTVGHVAYYFAGAGALFSADSLMVMGCGRLFEGTAAQMWDSIRKLSALPDDTLLYSGHEYAVSNLRFASSVDPENSALRARSEEISALRAEGLPTVPARLDLERATNPFLRPADPAIRERLGMKFDFDADVFAELRRRKDAF